MIPYTPITLGAGAISGIAIGCLLCVGLIILSALLGRKRRKSQPRRPRHRHNHRGGNISTISEASTIERHINMLEAIRAPMRSLSGLPSYSEQNLENMGYSSDGIPTLGRQGPVAVVFPPEEPPPPYDSVIKDNTEENPPRTASTVNTPDSTPGPSMSGAHTPEDDSYGFRSQSRPGSSRSASRRKSRERTPTRSHGAGMYNETPTRSHGGGMYNETPSHSTDTLGTSRDDVENIYEELSVPTLRPNQLRQEPSCTSAIQPTVPVSSPMPSPSSYSLGEAGHTEAVTASVHPPPIRTMPHQRIRLGTQALQNRPVAATYRPRNYYNDQSNAAMSSTAGHRGVGYEPLDPPGPYSIRPNPYDSIPSPTHTSTPVVEGNESDGFRNRTEPAINTQGRHSQRSHRRPDPDQSTHRLYGSHRNPPRNYGSNSPGRMPYQVHAPRAQTRANQPQTQAPRLHTQAPRPQTQAVRPTSQAPRGQSYTPRPAPYHLRAGSLSPRAMPNPALSPRAMPIDSALSPRAMPSPKTYSDHAPQRCPSPGDPTQVRTPLAADPTQPRPPLAANHSRDWNNSSFASTESQEQLIGSPPGVRYTHHPRADSNISSDIDSTSPLVAGRDEPATELEILTPTAV